VQYQNLLDGANAPYVEFMVLARGNLRQTPARPAKEAVMELRTRLNVLAAIVSFAFLTAVVFGMF
jgi:hypothetical protein